MVGKNKQMLYTPFMATTIEEIKAYVIKCLSTTKGSHAWDHTLRVYKLCMHIGEKEGVDLEVLKIACYLHDIARPYQDMSRGKVCHAEKGAEIAQDILKDYPISEKKKANIIHCIRSHRFRGSCRPATLEAKVLFDADKLDAIGAIGVARAFLFAGEVGARLHNCTPDIETTEPYTIEDTAYREFVLKLSRIKDSMLTKEGLKLAEKRHEFMEEFFKRFLLEHEGIK